MNDYNIKKIYEDMETEIISSMKRNYQRHLKEEAKTGFKYTQWQAEKLKELKRYQRENKNIISSYTKGLNKEISNHMQKELKQGSINAIKQYNKALGKNLKPSKVMNKSFFKINDKKVNALIKSVNNDLKKANTAILRMSNDQYRQVIHKSAMYVANGVFTEKQASGMATKELSELECTKLAIDEANKDFLNRGFNCIEYKDGRRVNVASYAQMAVRTANLRAQLMGEGDFRKSIGRTLVQATSHGTACPICQKWEKHIFIDDVYSGGKPDGKHMLLSDAMAQGFLHPNCRHGLTTYYPELEGIENETEEEYQADMDYINERINYIDRNIKRFDRLENGSVASLNIQRFGKKKKELENKKYELLNLYEKRDKNLEYYKSSALNSYSNKSYIYKDITYEFLKNKIPDSYTVTPATEIKVGEKTFKLNNKNKFNFENNEVPVAYWLEDTIGGPLELRFEITEEKYTNSADYNFWFEPLDLKEISKGSSKYSFGHEVTKQANNFLFDVSGNDYMTDELINENLKNIFKYKEHLNYVIIKRDNNLLGVYKKK